MIAPDDSYIFSGVTAKSLPGSCSSKHVIYCYFCTLCNKHYLGRSVTKLSKRANKHRSDFYKVLRAARLPNFDVEQFEIDNANGHDDSFTLGLHLILDHDIEHIDEGSFNDLYRVFIVQHSSPGTAEVDEHKQMHRLNSFRPNGLNRANTFWIPPLGSTMYANRLAH